MDFAKKKILLIGAEFGEYLASDLMSEGYIVNFVKAYGNPPREEVLDELIEHEYDMVIVSYWKSFDLLLEIRYLFPGIKTVFLNSYLETWEAIAKNNGVNIVLRIPFDLREFTERLNNELILFPLIDLPDIKFDWNLN